MQSVFRWKTPLLALAVCISCLVFGRLVYDWLRPTRPDELVGPLGPLAMQWVGDSGNGQIEFVGGDVQSGSLSGAGVHNGYDEGPGMRLPSPLRGQLEILYDVWCSGNGPAQTPPAKPFYTIALACAGGPQKYPVFYIQADSLPVPLQELEDFVPLFD